MTITVGGTNITLNSGSVLQDPPGTAPSYLCRAWVNFNGTGTVAIRASGNVSSITDNGTGDYTVNFTTAMSDANYSVAVSSQPESNGTNWTFGSLDQSTSPPITASSVRVGMAPSGAGGGGRVDTDYMCVTVFR